MKKYATSHEATVNKNCKVEFNKTKDGVLHLEIKTFNKDTVVLKEETFIEIMEWLRRYNKEVGSA